MLLGNKTNDYGSFARAETSTDLEHLTDTYSAGSTVSAADFFGGIRLVYRPLSFQERISDPFSTWTGPRSLLRIRAEGQ